VDGLKTGFTNASGYNIAISGVRDNRRLIVVVLGGPTRIARDRTAEGLLMTGFDVLDRRARGEQITVAQNFFEPPSMADATQPSTQQGDTDDRLRVVMASSPPPSRASQIQIVEPKSVPKLNGKGRKAEAGGRWTVQVGTFSNRGDARDQLAIMGKKYGQHFDRRPRLRRKGRRQVQGPLRRPHRSGGQAGLPHAEGQEAALHGDAPAGLITDPTRVIPVSAKRKTGTHKLGGADPMRAAPFRFLGRRLRLWVPAFASRNRDDTHLESSLSRRGR